MSGLFLSPSFFGGLVVTGSAWNPSDKSANGSLSFSNRKIGVVTQNGTFGAARGTRSWSTGKHVLQYTLAGTHSDSTGWGLDTSTHTITQVPGTDSGAALFQVSGQYYVLHNNGTAVDQLFTGVVTPITVGANDVILAAYDATSGSIWFAINGIWFNATFNAQPSFPSASPTCTLTAGTVLYPCAGATNTGETVLLNTNPSVGVPSGFSTWT